jgi:hypothetical protein
MMRLRTTNMSTKINLSEKKEMSEKKRVIRDLKASKRKASDTNDTLRSFYLRGFKNHMKLKIKFHTKDRTVQTIKIKDRTVIQRYLPLRIPTSLAMYQQAKNI